MPAMNPTTLPVLALCAANLLLIAALPRVFFRRGRLNAAWWATAAPFVLAGASLIAVAAGLVRPFALAQTTTYMLAALAALLASAASAVIGYTLGTHDGPVSLWHQENDTPARLVTRGAYARVRHPFYAAFLLALTACLAAAPHPLTLAALAAGVIQLRRTARREEGRLLVAFGEEYRAYMARTGRFVPRVRASSTAR
jgi:protein-S-isoprenylcysteine O-methyltransferase Ste14